MKTFPAKLLFILSIVSVVSSQGVEASAVQPNWWQGMPAVKHVRDISGPTVSKYCNPTKITVQRKAAIHPVLKDETHCLVQTSYGAISADATVLQPVGSSKAYEVKWARDIIPIPNHPGALYRNNATYSYGQSMSVYKDFYSSLKLTYDGIIWYYELNTGPDTYFRHTSDNALRQLNEFDTLTFSSDGHEFVVEDRRSGFIKVNLTTMNITQILASNGSTSSGAFLDSDVALSKNGLIFVGYNAPGGWGSPYAEIIDSGSCVSVPERVSNWINRYPCKHRNIRAEIQEMVPGLTAIYNPRFTSERTLVFDVRTNINGNVQFAEYAMTAPGEKYRELEYLAMGDSFASGQGVGSYRAGTDTERNRCHQSILSYPYLFAKYFESSASVACSGAKLHNISKSDSDKDLRAHQLTHGRSPTQQEIDSAPVKFEPGYIQQKDFIGKQPSTITISIGGNDIKFAEKLNACIDIPELKLPETCFETYEERLEIITQVNSRLQRLRNTFKEIKAQDQERKVYVIGYPQIAKPDGNCGANVQLNQAELEAAHDLVHYLNRVIKEAADEAGVYYVDIETSLYGYRLCETKSSEVAVNGVTTRFDQGKWIETTESFHPNGKGHELMATAIRAKTNNFTKPMPQPKPELASLPITDDIEFLRNAPKSNRKVYDVRYEESPLYPTFKGDPQELILEGKTQLLKPNYGFEAVLHSTPIDLGTYVTDSQGNLHATYTVPQSVEPGYHTVHFYGKDVFNNDIDIQKIVFVAASEDDIDGDGVPNGQDVCVGVQNSEDIDKDAIPDLCDPFIDTAPPVKAGAMPIISDSTVVIPGVRHQHNVLSASTPLQASDSMASFLMHPRKNDKQTGNTLRHRVDKITSSKSTVVLLICGFTLVLCIAIKWRAI